MYSGITQGLYPVVSIKKSEGLLEYAIALPDNLLKGLKQSASVSIDGVCQTVVSITGEQVFFQAMQETLSLTTLNLLTLNQKVSVERSVKMGDELGGHDIYGHITGTATVVDHMTSENNLTLTLQCQSEWMKYILPKGFIALDGSSLTVGKVDNNKNQFEIHLIPETLKLTNFSNKKIGDFLNLELDHKTFTIVQTVESCLQNLKNL
jgi:riboflavin synthase